jgi:hypothetical protein
MVDDPITKALTSDQYQELIAKIAVGPSNEALRHHQLRSMIQLGMSINQELIKASL